MILDSHRTPTRMAEVLVQYMDDAERIRSAILSEFNSAPTIRTIRLLREDYLRPGKPPIRFKPERDAYADSMERANVAFMRALASTYPQLIRKAA